MCKVCKQCGEAKVLAEFPKSKDKAEVLSAAIEYLRRV